jgi:hypothetical protein
MFIRWKPILITAAAVAALGTGAWAIHAAAPFTPRADVPAGTEIAVRLESTLSTDASKSGDHFTAVVSEPVLVDRKIAIPAGAEVRGHVVEATPAGHMAGRGYLQLAWDQVSYDGRSYSLSTTGPRFESRTPTRKNVEWIGGGALAGGVIGGLAGGSALKGAVLGGAAGTVGAAVTPGPHLTLTAGRELRFRTDHEMKVLAAARA